jgi:CII-binding regulator of phage lambda lysogenization HflD
MIAKISSESEDKEFKNLVAGLKGLKMITTQKDAAKYYQEVLAKLPKSYEELVTVKEKGKNIKFLTKGTNDKISELLLVIGGTNEFMLLSIVGDIDLNNVAKLANKINIQGSEHLDKVTKKD